MSDKKPWSNAGVQAPAVNPPADKTGGGVTGAQETNENAVNGAPSQGSNGVPTLEEAQRLAEMEAREATIRAAAEAQLTAEKAAKTAVAKLQDVAAKDGLVIVSSTKEVRIMLDHQVTTVIPKGTSRQPLEVAEHWYARANGVQKFEG